MKNKRNEVLARLAERQDIIKSHVSSVVDGHNHAFFLYGPGGHGKSHAVTEELDTKPGPKKWIHHNSHVTAAALCDILQANSDSIHVFEDCEGLYKDRIAAGILRSACSAPKGRPRIVTYETKTKFTRFEFTGGIIIVSNESLKTHGIIGAVASRFGPVEWKLTNEEIAAIIMESAEKGYTHNGTKVSVKDCVEVAEFLIQELDSAKQVDLRTYFDHALPAFTHWKSGKSRSHWKDLIKSKLQGKVVIESRTSRLDREREIAESCRVNGNNTTERLLLWKEATGKGKQSYYDRLKEADADQQVIKQLQQAHSPHSLSWKLGKSESG